MTTTVNWADAHANPEEPGRYFRKYPNGGVRGSYWDGRVWHRAEVTEKGASKNPPHRIASAFQFLPWRQA